MSPRLASSVLMILSVRGTCAYYASNFDLRILNSLSLHVAMLVRPAALQWLDVIDHVAGAGTGSLARRWARVRPLERAPLGRSLKDFRHTSHTDAGGSWDCEAD